MQAHRIETFLEANGTVTLHDLPFQAGEAVEIIVLTRSIKAQPTDAYLLRGTNVSYTEPTEPVASEEWGALS